MNMDVQKILDQKIRSIVYYAQKKPRIQLIRVMPLGLQKIMSSERQVMIDYLKTELSQTTEVSDSSTNESDFMIYIEVPDGEDPSPLRDLRSKFKKTP